MLGRGVGRVELRDHRVADPTLERGAGQLAGVVATQVPRHRLEPCEGVHGGPRLDPVLGQAQGQDRVLERHRGGRALLLDPRVDPVGVGRERPAGLRLEHGELLLGHPAPAHRADHLVGLDAGLAHELGEAAGGDVPAGVHLEEAVLRLHIALRPHEVAHGVGVDVGDALGVPQHVDVTGQSPDLERPVGLGKGAAPLAEDDPGEHHDEHDDEGQRHVEAAAYLTREGHPARLDASDGERGMR